MFQCMPECIVELMSRDKQWATVVLNLESHHPTTRRTNLAALRFLRDQMGQLQVSDGCCK